MIFLIGCMIFLLPFLDTKSLFISTVSFLIQHWSRILRKDIGFLCLMIKQKQKEKRKTKKFVLAEHTETLLI